MFAELCHAEAVPVQHYVVRTDLPCGSTVGPIPSTLFGRSPASHGPRWCRSTKSSRTWTIAQRYSQRIENAPVSPSSFNTPSTMLSKSQVSQARARLTPVSASTSRW